MPLNEYPCDESWGYQATGFFSPTSRYGTADQLKAFVDACHKHGIGVLMDFVPIHFAVDAYGLANYDGSLACISSTAWNAVGLFLIKASSSFVVS